jgi:DNA polymerase
MCSLCEGAFSFNYEYKGKNSDKTKLLFVANRSDSREPEPHKPLTYLDALLKSYSGIFLQEILGHCGITMEEIWFTNIYKCKLPNDREPRKNEYTACLGLFDLQLEEFNPKKIMVFGRKSFCTLFPELSDNYKEYISKTIKYKDYPILLSYHLASIPSNVGNLGKRKVYYDKIKQFLLL